MDKIELQKWMLSGEKTDLDISTQVVVTWVGGAPEVVRALLVDLSSPAALSPFTSSCFSSSIIPGGHTRVIRTSHLNTHLLYYTHVCALLFSSRMFYPQAQGLTNRLLHAVQTGSGHSCGLQLQLTLMETQILLETKQQRHIRT